MREIKRFPNKTEECDECGGEAVRVEETEGQFTTVGWECRECHNIMPA